MTCDILSCHPQGYTSLFRGIEWCFRVYESSEYLGRSILEEFYGTSLDVTSVTGLVIIIPVMEVYIIPV